MVLALSDADGHLIYLKRMDGAPFASVDVAMKKAQTATAFRRPTKVFEDAVAAGGVGLRFLTIPGLIAVDGGYRFLSAVR